MTTKDLIKQTIKEIRILISSYSYEGSMPLEQIEVEIKLNNDLIIDYPFHPDTKLKPKSNFSPKLKKIYPQPVLNKLVSRDKLWRKIKGQEIIGIWKIDDDFGDEICGLELSNGYFIVKGPMSPIGTGNADLFILDNRERVKSKYNSDIEKIH